MSKNNLNTEKRKNVLVTGGNRGIGRAIALEFAKHHYNVLITYKTSTKAAQDVVSSLRSLGSRAYMVKADFSNLNEIKNVFLACDKYFISLDVLVNNVGWTKYIPHERLDDLNEDIFNKVINLNLSVAFFCAKHAIKRMRGENCSIINISSTAGISGMGSNIAYCAAKAGTINMTKSLARMAGPNIRVNSVAPGLTETDMTKSAPLSYKRKQIKNSPLNRIAQPEDIANVVFCLAEKMNFVNGQTIVVDGGIII